MRSRRSIAQQPVDRLRDKVHREPPLRESFHLLVKCRDEAQQRDLYERLTADGHRCRVLSL